MGIKQLSSLLKDNCKKGIKQVPLGFYSSKKIGIDASMFIYQFLIAVRADGMALGNDDGTTSHLVGLFYRTIRLIEAGITPVYVFDGAPPESKLNELKKRSERRDKAEDELLKAELAGDKELVQKYEKRKTKICKEHVDDCKRLLNLMGVPYLDAPSEAEAFCAFLCRKSYIYGVATEDMDGLTFGSPILLRNFTASQAKKLPVIEYKIEVILKELGLNMDEFIDLCILLGCDFCETIKGIGVKKALIFIKKYRRIEKIIENEKVEITENFDFENARSIFNELPNLECNVNEEDLRIKWDNINLENIKKFLVEEKQFDKGRVEKGVEKLLKIRTKPKQATLDSFLVRK